ncbi:MAG TPA: enoyl-CoA hydratase [Acidiphilium sp.]|nr:MAG: enoyl-CoA hydratase [Acidiphilium sp. 21-60-14]OYV89602.1 MAG: enoyl-CoA hydratase [Acidiphilium sp. 37-60-79]OZB39360.1 MAG: enoyl-CoA hydratase [Acidiphilium sp. 34-60-192]HQT88754.1 enoyl-CoA hydratase [Acidiphilium sp.]HQU24609.1 enoyl-CoA hydratase [Acidiphilium sp.]
MDLGDTETLSEPLLIDRDARGVLTLTLNRPRRYNALSDDLLAALTRAIQRIAADQTARVVVLAAKGAAFSAGHDLHEMMARHEAADHRYLFERCSAVMLGLQALPVPVIAKVQGIATAAGCQLVASCDLAIAAASARFAVSGINLGLFCSTPSVALARAMPRKPALEMLMTGEMIDANEAERRFLINHAVADDALDAAVEALVVRILEKPRVALEIGKKQFYRQIELGTAAAYEVASEAMACNMGDHAARDGIAQFLANRSSRAR